MRHRDLADDVDALSHTALGLALDVRKELGPGLSERIYEGAMRVELEEAGIPYACQPCFRVHYKQRLIGSYRPDLLINGLLVLEIKSVELLRPLLAAQVPAHLRVTRLSLGLLINFNSFLLKEGIRRIVRTR